MRPRGPVAEFAAEAPPLAHRLAGRDALGEDRGQQVVVQRAARAEAQAGVVALGLEEGPGCVDEHHGLVEIADEGGHTVRAASRRRGPRRWCAALRRANRAAACPARRG